MELLRKTRKPVELVLKDASLRKKNIDEIVLVGGSTRIPKVQEGIEAQHGVSRLMWSWAVFEMPSVSMLPSVLSPTLGSRTRQTLVGAR